MAAPMQLDDWLEHARRDAAQRGLPDLDPLLEMLLRATRALRAADWAGTDPAGSTRAATGADPGDDTRPAAPRGNGP